MLTCCPCAVYAENSRQFCYSEPNLRLVPSQFSPEMKQSPENKPFLSGSESTHRVRIAFFFFQLLWRHEEFDLADWSRHIIREEEHTVGLINSTLHKSLHLVQTHSVRSD